MQDFRKIKAWQRAHVLGLVVVERARRFTKLGHAGLRSQLIGCASGIGAAIAEGAGSATKKEFARYLDIAIKSASETENHLLVARDHRLIEHDVWLKLNAETIEIRKMIYAYRKKILASIGEDRIR
jgi:four helix bundle protein